MNWHTLGRSFIVQFVSNGLLLGVAWYWLSLGVGSALQIGLNVALAMVMLVGWSVLTAYGLGKWRNWMWALPAVVLTPLLGYHFAAMLLIPLLWLLVLLPTAAVGRWKLLAGPQYLLVCIALLAAMTVIPAALLNWVPKFSGLNGQLGSFGGRALLAYAIAVGSWSALLTHIGINAQGKNTAI